MGLLDEAIREHLELKRRSGADPTAVEREEREALAPAFSDGDGDDGGQPQGAVAEIPPATTVPVDDPLGGDARLADLSSVGQDTAELDMQAVLEEDTGAAEATSAVAPGGDDGGQSAHSGALPGEESPAWEIGSEPDREPPPDIVPGQERLSFD